MDIFRKLKTPLQNFKNESPLPKSSDFNFKVLNTCAPFFDGSPKIEH